MSEFKLTVERKSQDDDGLLGGGIAMTPSLGHDYWSYRVMLSETQAVVAFPKFGTIGCGFAVESEGHWNTNLPVACEVDGLYDHIKDVDPTQDEETVKTAIRMIQEAVEEDDPEWWAERVERHKVRRDK
jgi:hypothetical protein